MTQEEILSIQLDRLNSINFEEFVDKVIIKYNSEEYISRWMRRGIDPPKDLYLLIFKCAEKFGECLNINYNDEFISYYYKKYLIAQIDGQESIIEIYKTDIFQDTDQFKGKLVERITPYYSYADPELIYYNLTKKQREEVIVPVRDSQKNPKIGRNDICPCGSNKKYKNCCLIKNKENGK